MLLMLGGTKIMCESINKYNNKTAVVTLMFPGSRFQNASMGQQAGVVTHSYSM